MTSPETAYHVVALAPQARAQMALELSGYRGQIIFRRSAGSAAWIECCTADFGRRKHVPYELVQGLGGTVAEHYSARPDIWQTVVAQIVQEHGGGDLDWHRIPVAAWSQLIEHASEVMPVPIKQLLLTRREARTLQGEGFDVVGEYVKAKPRADDAETPEPSAPAAIELPPGFEPHSDDEAVPDSTEEVVTVTADDGETD